MNCSGGLHHVVPRFGQSNRIWSESASLVLWTFRVRRILFVVPFPIKRHCRHGTSMPVLPIITLLGVNQARFLRRPEPPRSRSTADKTLKALRMQDAENDNQPDGQSPVGLSESIAYWETDKPSKSRAMDEWTRLWDLLDRWALSDGKGLYRSSFIQEDGQVFITI